MEETEERVNIETEDIEKYSSDKDLKYSRSASIMRMTNKVQDILSKEMKPSYLITKRDKLGNEIDMETDDQRLEGCNAITTLRNCMQCDFDEEIIGELETLDNKINEWKELYMDSERKEWEQLNPVQQRNLIKSDLGFTDGLFNRRKRFGELFTRKKIEKHRLIFEALIRLQKRSSFYKGETYEG